MFSFKPLDQCYISLYQQNQWMPQPLIALLRRYGKNHIILRHLVYISDYQHGQDEGYDMNKM